MVPFGELWIDRDLFGRVFYYDSVTRVMHVLCGKNARLIFWSSVEMILLFLKVHSVTRDMVYNSVCTMTYSVMIDQQNERHLILSTNNKTFHLTMTFKTQRSGEKNGYIPEQSYAHRSFGP